MSLRERTRPGLGIIEPCLPSPAKAPPSGPGWLHEIKKDGFRSAARWCRCLADHPSGQRFHSALSAHRRSDLNTARRSFLIDGEAIVTNDRGVAVFDLIRRQRHGEDAVMVVFDLIELNGNDVRRSPIEYRKRMLAKLVRERHPGIVVNEHDGEMVFQHACKLGCEGIVSKRLGSMYRRGRSPHWVKVKKPKSAAVKREAEEDWEAVMAPYKQRKFSDRGRSQAPESRQTDSAPIRATVPLTERYYVAVDRQLKSGFGTYEAAEKAAKEIKKRYPNPQVTVFDAKKRSHTAIDEPMASTKRREH